MPTSSLGWPGTSRNNRGTVSSFSRQIEGLNSLFAKFFHASFNALGSHAKCFDDFNLLASSLANELGSKHSKRDVVALVMEKDGLDAAKIRIVASSPNDADSIVQGCSPIGDQG